MAPTVVEPASDFEWDKLAFGLYPTAGYVSYTWKDGEWGKAEWVKEPYLQLHVGSVALNYGASAFEGLKAFRAPDGQVRVFRPRDNAARISHSAEVLSMPSVPEELFLEAVQLAVGRNLHLVPPHAAHGASGSLYIRPLLFASGANLILNPPDEFKLIVYVTPTGSLYGTAGSKAPAIDAFVIETFDRAAPRGVGHSKAAGNYAPTFRHTAAAKKAGYQITLHLDSATRKNIDEFSTSNFLAIKKRDSADSTPILVVPSSESILKSVTTKAIIGIAESFGWQVEKRVVPFAEVVEGQYEEVCACGTAAALTPIRSITYHDTPETTQKISIGDGENAGPCFLKVLSELTAVQSGIKTNPHAGEMFPAEGIDGSK